MLNLSLELLVFRAGACSATGPAHFAADPVDAATPNTSAGKQGTIATTTGWTDTS